MENMQKKLVVILIVGLITAVGISNVSGVIQGGKSSYYATGEEIVPQSGEDELLARALIKTGNNADIVAEFSAVGILITDVMIEGKGKGTQVSDEDIARLEVWVNVTNEDGTTVTAEPGRIVWEERVQRLSGELNMLWDPDLCETVGYVTTCGDWSEEGQWIELYTKTSSANSYHFVAPNLPNGDHEVKVYARVTLLSEYCETVDEVMICDSPSTSIEPWGAFGPRTLVLDQVRMVDQGI